MCGRFQQDLDSEEVKRIIDEIDRKNQGSAERLTPATGEIRPSNAVAVLGRDGPEVLRWSYYDKAKKTTILNARVENRYWGSAINQRRIAVPTTGFYEWTHPNGKAKDKYLFRLPNEDILYLAGIYVYHTTDNGEQERRFLVLTTEPNDSIKDYHNRMPVCMGKADMQSFIADTNSAQDIVRRVQSALTAYKA